MSRISRTLLASVAIVVSSSFPVFSQQLAEEVIEEYFAEIRAGGSSVEPGIKTVSGNSVEWTDVVILGPENSSKMVMAFIRAEEIGGDKVSVTYPETLDVEITPPNDGPNMTMSMELGDLKHIISGSSDARRHDHSANRQSIKMTSDKPAFTMSAELRDINSSYLSSGGDIRNFKGEMSASGIDVSYSINEEDVNMAMTMSYEGFVADFDIDAVKEENMQQLLTGERGMVFNFELGAGSSTTDIKQPEFSGVITAAAAGTSGSFAVVEGVFKMLSQTDAISYDLKFTEIPLPPFQADIDFAEISMEMPLKKTEGTLPVNFLMNFTGLKASDTIWGMVDPTGSLPRDKATLNIDLTANMKWLVDLVELESAAGMPAEVQDVTINNITLDVAGARLEGQGSAVMDNSKFPPEPVGSVDLDLKGGVGLLDKLVALGLVPQEQGQMAKMFSGMFAVPGGDGDDHLTSKIEMKEGGSILVNGQQVK